MQFYTWLEQVKLATEEGTWALQWYLQECLKAKEQKRLALAKVRELSRTSTFSSDVKLLRSIVGIGLRTAMTILTEIEDIAENLVLRAW